MAEGMDLNSALTKIDNFVGPSQLERLKLLAAAVVPFGSIEHRDIKIPETYRVIKLSHSDSSIPLFIRLLRNAGVEQKYVSLLQPFLPSAETPDLNNLYFTELLITVSDHLGNNDFLRKLKNRIPDDKVGCAKENITTAVQLFQRLLQERTLSLDKKNESLELLAGWLDDIGRKDIGSLVRKKKDEVFAAAAGDNGENQPHGGVNAGDAQPDVTPIQETHR